MNTLIQATTRFLKDEEGASAIEYALILGMVALAIIGVSGDIKDKVTTIFTSIKNAL